MANLKNNKLRPNDDMKPSTVAHHVAHPLVVGKVISLNLGVITKDVRNDSYCCYVRCAKS